MIPIIEYKTLNNTCKIVYRIFNTINSKSYIGITNNLKRRIRDHIRYSINEYHIKNYIHKALLKYGINNFQIEVLCTCETHEELNEREVYYINLFETFNKEKGYNLTLGGNREIPNEETIIKKINSSKKTKVAQYNLQGELINTFSSIKEASRILGIDDSSIHRCCKLNWSRKNYMFQKYIDTPLNKILPYTSKRGDNLKKENQCLKLKEVN
jgi:hypothetical protein